jgi:KRAB domain-containing zinc finger protein
MNRQHVDKEPKPKTAKKIYECDCCARKYKCRHHFIKHVKNHISTSDSSEANSRIKKEAIEKIICDQCSMLIRPQHIAQHNFSHHSNKEPIYFCKYPGCTKSYRYVSSFKAHEARVHLKIKNFKCSFCEKEFFEKTNYQKHLQRHLEPEKFKCSTCMQCFVNAIALTAHVRLHNENHDGPRPFVCQECNNSYRYEDQLKKHFQRSHKGISYI